MTDEEMAEDFANSFDYTDNSNYENNYQKDSDKIAYESYLAGLKASRPQWHDLKKDSSDLPEPYATVLDEDGNKITYQGGGKWTFYSDYYEMDIDAIRPVAWCEIPTFEV